MTLEPDDLRGETTERARAYRQWCFDEFSVSVERLLRLGASQNDLHDELEYAFHEWAADVDRIAKETP